LVVRPHDGVDRTRGIIGESAATLKRRSTPLSGAEELAQKVG
jgi:hypothetical protein